VHVRFLPLAGRDRDAAGHEHRAGDGDGGDPLVVQRGAEDERAERSISVMDDIVTASRSARSRRAAARGA
jgi:hypothetical protein